VSTGRSAALRSSAWFGVILGTGAIATAVAARPSKT